MQSVNPVLVAGDLILDFDAAEVFKGGQRVDLTLSELRILEHLARNSVRVVTYDSLASRVLGMEAPGSAEARLMRVHVQHLRSKLGDPAKTPRYISNVRGLGYKFNLPVTSIASARDRGPVRAESPD